MKTTSASALSILLVVGLSTAAFAEDAGKPTRSVNQAAGESVGISSQDGISLSGTGADVIVTRNGAAQTITKEVKLENGYRVLPDGTVFTSGENKVMLRPGQVLLFDGTVLETQRRTAPASGTTTTTTVTGSPGK